MDRRSLPLIPIVLAVAVVALSALGLLVWQGMRASTPPVAALGVINPPIELGGPFKMVDHTGREVSEADFRGRPMLLYFGFTYCPDVCPTELGGMAAAVAELGDEGDAVQPVFVTVDPERDTPEQMAGYVGLFHPRMVGLTGSADQVAAMARAWRIYYAKAQDPQASEYTMDHSGFVYLMGADGQLVSIFQPGTAPEVMARVMRETVLRS